MSVRGTPPNAPTRSSLSVRLKLADTKRRSMGKRRRRRSWADEEKRSICQQTAAPGVSVAQVARQYALNANRIFKWLKDPRFMPERVEDEPVFLLVEVAAPTAAAVSAPPSGIAMGNGRIEIELTARKFERARSRSRQIFGCLEGKDARRLSSSPHNGSRAKGQPGPTITQVACLRSQSPEAYLACATASVTRDRATGLCGREWCAELERARRR